MAIASLAATAQKKIKEPNTLLWEISGNGLERPSYLFGTIHMICAEDAVLSDSMVNAIRGTDAVYLEVDMDNLFEMVAVFSKMKMRNDTTLADLLSKEDYEKVKKYFEAKGNFFSFATLETYKPLLASSMLMESGTGCPSAKAMEEVIMKEAKSNRKSIKGLETMAYQMAIFDSIPYKLQADLLVKHIDDVQKGKSDGKEYQSLIEAYKEQDLSKLEQLSVSADIGFGRFIDILLYNRNKNWVEKLKDILPGKSIVIAVGAGHLPGELGVISLLRKAGYTLKPMLNKVNKIRKTNTI